MKPAKKPESATEAYSRAERQPWTYRGRIVTCCACGEPISGRLGVNRG